MMNKLLGILLLLALGAPGALAADKEVERLESAAAVMNEIMGTPDNAIPHELLDRAVCVGIIPGQLKFAIGIGGTYGAGALVCRRGGNGPWGGPTMFHLGGANIGFQLGGQSTDIVFIVMNAGGARKLLQSKVKLGAEASAAAGPVGRSAVGETDAQMHAEILSYSRSRGLFAGISLEGAVFKQDNDGNERLYGRKLTAQDIVLSGKVGVPAAAKNLDAALTRYSPHGGQPFSKR
jgi:SH3 domain-containing YSC84-like protein 1